MRKLLKSLFIISLILPATVFASTSLGDIANTLMGPTAIVSKLLRLACYIIGVAFILMSLAQYKIHRQSPKLVPLGTPVMLLILGVVALMVPYLTTKFETGNAEKEVSTSQPTTLPMPETPHSRGPSLPLPSGTDQGASSPDQNVAPPPPASEPVSPGSANWTQDPRYNQ